MKKIALTSLVALFAVVGAAQAVGTQNPIIPLGAGTSGVVTSQIYVNRVVDQQVGLETAERVKNEGDLQFTGAAATATDITKAINALDTAITNNNNNAVQSVNSTDTHVVVNNTDAQNPTLALSAAAQTAVDKVGTSTLSTAAQNLSDAINELNTNATADQITSGEITGTDVTGTGTVADNTITFANVTINNGAVTGAKIANNTITTANVAGTAMATSIDTTGNAVDTKLATEKAVADALTNAQMSADACTAPNILVGDPTDPTHFICQTVIE